MKERFLDELRREELSEKLYPDQYEMMNNEQCVNCLSFNTSPVAEDTFFCEECGVTMYKMGDNDLRLA